MNTAGARRLEWPGLGARRLEWIGLGALVLGACTLYSMFALRVGTFLPDEFYFSLLARYSIQHFPSGLWAPGIYLRGIQRVDQLFLMIPFWLLRGPRSIQVAHVIQALLYSSTAIPVWLLARDAGLRLPARALATVLAIVSPWAVISTSLLTESAAYPAYAWALYATWRAAAMPSRKIEVLAVLALAVAALSRTQLVAMAPILPLAVLWQEWRSELADRPLPQRARALPGRLWLRHPVVTAVSGVALVVIVLSFTVGLPGNGVAGLAGGYGLPPLEPFEALKDRYQDYLSRVAVGTGLVAPVLAIGWTLRTLVAPSDRRLHALAIVCTLGIAAMLASILHADPDERYVMYSAVPIGLAFAAELQSGVLAGRAGLARALGACVGAAVVILLVTRQAWPATSAPYEYFSFPVAVFYGHAVLGKLTLLPLHTFGISASTLVAIVTVVVAAAWVAAAASQRAMRPAGAIAAVLVVGLCATAMLYSLQKFTTSEAAGAGGPDAAERSWIEANVPSGTQVAAVGTGLGGSGAYGPIWQATEFWNASVMNGVSFNPFSMPTALPFGAADMLLSTTGTSGLVLADLGPPYVYPRPVPEYLLMPAQGTNPIAFEGQVLGHSPDLPVELVKLKQPPRLRWIIGGTSTEGFMTSGQPVSATVFGGALSAGTTRTCASFSLIAPPGVNGRWPGRWTYRVANEGSGSQTLARGSLVSEQTKPITVPLAPYRTGGNRLAAITVTVNGSVRYVTGALVSARLAFFAVAPCPNAATSASRS